MSTNITFTVVVTVDGPNEAEMPTLFREYLTTPDYPFMTDYGHGATHDGWDGPFVTGVTVTTDKAEPVDA